jgi:hypothetical protein
MINWLESARYARLLPEVALGTYRAQDGVPESIRHFLARLRLLYGVPFNYLVPDSRLLPVESVRFFYLDRNFTDRLVDGALSVGKTTTREFLHARERHDDVRRGVDEEERLLREEFRTGARPRLVPAATRADVTGLLLRSRAVSGWPGLEVKAYRGTVRSTPDEGGTRLALLRMDRLSPDVLLCLFDGIPSRVDIEEPREGMQFGVDLQDPNGDGVVEPDAATPSGFRLKLRRLRGADAGTTIDRAPAPGASPRPVTIPVPVRRGNRRVVHVARLQQELTAALTATGDADARPLVTTLNAGELAVQLFQFPFRQRFEGEGDPPSTGGAPWTVTTQYAARLQVRVFAEPLSAGELRLLFPLATP